MQQQQISGNKKLINNMFPVVKLERFHLENEVLKNNQVIRKHQEINSYLGNNCNKNIREKNGMVENQFNSTSSASRRPYHKRKYPFGKENENKNLICNINIQNELNLECQTTFINNSVSRHNELSSSKKINSVVNKNEENYLYCKTCSKSIVAGKSFTLSDQFKSGPESLCNHICDPVRIKDCVVKLTRLKTEQIDRLNRRHKTKHIDNSDHYSCNRMLTDEDVWEGIKSLRSPEILVLPPSVCLKISHSAIDDVYNLLEDEDFNKTIILAPISNAVKNEKSGFNTEGSHWSLLVIDVRDRQYYHFDSVPGLNKKSALKFSESINAFLNFTPLQFKERKCDKQQDEFSCGKEVIKNAKEQVSLLGYKTAPEFYLRSGVNKVCCGRLGNPRVVLENISARVNKQVLNVSVNLNLSAKIIHKDGSDLLLGDTKNQISYAYQNSSNYLKRVNKKY